MKVKKVEDEHKMKFFQNNLKNWLKKYYGVATKYLESYLSLFVLFNIKKKINSMELFNKLSLENKFIKIEEIKIM